MKKWKIYTEKQINKLICERVSIALEKENSAYKREMLLKQANLATLQSQINPHFLYNTLECIRGMALLRNEAEIADIAQALSSFFRYSISGNSDIVSLQEELNNIVFYTKIQKYRFLNRFNVYIDDSPEIRDAMIPKLTLQPIVENAVIHGMANVVEHGEIHVKAEKLDENVILTISDNGEGMEEDKLLQLVDKISGKAVFSKEGAHSGIGLHNVDQRLKLHFGNEYGIAVYSMKNAGTDVTVRIPYRPLKE